MKRLPHVLAVSAMTLSVSACTVSTTAGVAVAAPAKHTTSAPATSTTSTATTSTPHATSAAQRGTPCKPVRPERDFYEAGRVASRKLTTPTSRCTTISVSNVVDAMNPADRCQTFLLAFWPLVDGSLTYTEPVTACGQRRTVLARDVPDGVEYQVIYAVDYIEPEVQTVDFRVWH